MFSIWILFYFIFGCYFWCAHRLRDDDDKKKGSKHIIEKKVVWHLWQAKAPSSLEIIHLFHFHSQSDAVCCELIIAEYFFCWRTSKCTSMSKYSCIFIDTHKKKVEFQPRNLNWFHQFNYFWRWFQIKSSERKFHECADTFHQTFFLADGVLSRIFELI